MQNAWDKYKQTVFGNRPFLKFLYFDINVLLFYIKYIFIMFLFKYVRNFVY